MRDVIIRGARAHFIGNINKHLANIEIYMNNTMGIGEHSDIIETVELELEQVANYHDKLEMLERYFIKPQQKQSEGVEDEKEQSD